MKYIYLSIFLLALSCGGLKKENKTNTTTPVSTVKETVIEAKKETPKITYDKLLVVLKNPNALSDVKALVKNSGLQWSATAFENETTKIGVVQVPSDKKDFWIDRLQKSGEFKTVTNNNKATLDALIKKATSTYFSIRKTECFGDCPVYEVSIDEKGNVVYNGLKYVNEVGERKFALTEKELKKFKEALAKSDFSTYEKVYDNPELMDLPSTYITFDGKQTQIRLWKDIPKDLINVHEFVDGLLYNKKFFN